MKCINCGRAMKSRKENYRYTECGLDTVTLADIEVRHCANCGETEAVIENAEHLHRALARYVAKKTTRLTGQEIKFLRKYLGYSGTDYAAAAGVAPETVSRWEHEKAVMGPAAERMLRLMVLYASQLSEYDDAQEAQREVAEVKRLLPEMAKGKPVPVRVKMKEKNKRWQPAAVVA
jgi:putative zinc finger/helix-turn-helix YgiT family protein